MLKLRTLLPVYLLLALTGCNSQESTPRTAENSADTVTGTDPATETGSPSQPDDSTTQPEEPTTPEEPDTSVSTRELSTLDEFTFDNIQTISLDIALPELAQERAVVNVCFPNDAGTIDRRNCLLQSPLDQGVIEASLNPGLHQTRLLMEIWRFSDLENPLEYEWSHDQGADWLIR